MAAGGGANVEQLFKLSTCQVAQVADKLKTCPTLKPLRGHLNLNSSSLCLWQLKLLRDDLAHLGREFLAAGRLKMHVTTFFAEF